jgi:hypothetical protein
MKPLLKQPLLHFLALGVLLFLFHGWVSQNDSEDGDRIVIDDAALREFVQYRSRSFDAASIDRKLAAMNPEERRQLVDRLVREEALYREAKRLGLDRDDYVIKQRLVQKMEYLARGFGAPAGAVDPAALNAYYRDHRERYREPPSVTFAHVFIDADRHGEPAQYARTLGQQLNAGAEPFSRAMGYGDRFLYHTNYVERSDDFVASHFGAGFAEAVFDLAPDDSRWQGPIASDHGYHLVMLTGKDSGGVPALETIRDRVAQDARRAWLDRQTEDAIRTIVDSYDVERRTGQQAAREGQQDDIQG